MSFDGFLSFGGIELINAQRTEAYINNLMPQFGLIRRTHIYDNINVALEQEPYRSPVLDGAEWMSPDEDATHGFYGLYPLSIEGIGDSTVTASVTEGILDGGVVGAERAATRSIRIRGLLVGDDEEAVEAGLTWLRNALLTNGCGMHGDLCGYKDLRYFLAPPNAAVECYYPFPESGSGDIVEFGPLSADTSPLVYSLDLEGELRPMQTEWNYLGEWEGQGVDSAIVRYGAMSDTDGSIIDISEPIYLRRSNFILNPSFTTSNVSWSQSIDGGSSIPVSRIVTPDRTFGRTGETLANILTNWLPDPSFENGTPESRGWRSTTPGGVAAVTDGTAPNGTKVAAVAGVAGATELEVTLTGPYDPIPGFLRGQIKQSVDDVIVELYDNDALLLESHTIPASALTSTWNVFNVAFTNPIFDSYVLRFSTAGTQEFRVDALILSSMATNFFDGDTPDAGGFVYSFDGGNPSNASRRVQTLAALATLRTPHTDAPFAPAILTFEMRSPEASPSVTVRLVDIEENVVASVVIQPTHEWQSYALGTDYGRRVRVEMVTNAQFDLDRVKLEAGSTILPYFDGDSGNDIPYLVQWLGTPNNSISRKKWGGRAVMAKDFKFRPFITLEQGYIPRNSLNVQWGTKKEIRYQIEPVDRTYHNVSTTVGVKRIRDYNTQVGAATEVDFILTAATPHAFSTWDTRLFFDGAPENEYISDTQINLSPNPSSETATTNLNGAAGSGVAGVSNPTVATDFGTKVFRSTWTTATTAPSGGHWFSVPVNAGSAYSFGVGHVRSSVDVRLQLRVSWRTAGDAEVYSVATNGMEAVGGVTYGFDEFTLANVPAPATAVSARVYVESVDGFGSGNFTIASTFDTDGRMVNFGSTLLPYFDGSTTDTAAWTYSWVGTAGVSASRREITVVTVNPLIDPDLPVVPAPPRAPVIYDSALDYTQTNWLRYYLPIPAGNVALWAGTVPTITFATKTEDIRQMRVRFFPNPFSRDPEQLDPMDYCGEFLLSYLPSNSTLTVSGMVERATAQVAGAAPVAADHLLYGTGGTPMTWPELSCGIAYVMTVDILPSETIDNLDIELVVNRRE